MGLAESFWNLLGNWSGVEEQSASRWGAAAHARAALSFKLDLGGTAVVQDYRQVREESSPLTTELRELQRAELSGGRGGSSPLMTEFLAHGVFLADQAAPEVVLWWLFDSVGHPPDPGRGGWAGDTLELTRTSTRATAFHRFHLGPDRLAYEIDVAVAGQETVPFLRGRYERVSGH